MHWATRRPGWASLFKTSFSSIRSPKNLNSRSLIVGSQEKNHGRVKTLRKWWVTVQIRLRNEPLLTMWLSPLKHKNSQSCVISHLLWRKRARVLLTKIYWHRQMTKVPAAVSMKNWSAKALHKVKPGPNGNTQAWNLLYPAVRKKKVHTTVQSPHSSQAAKSMKTIATQFMKLRLSTSHHTKPTPVLKPVSAVNQTSNSSTQMSRSTTTPKLETVKRKASTRSTVLKPDWSTSRTRKVITLCIQTATFTTRLASMSGKPTQQTWMKVRGTHQQSKSWSLFPSKISCDLQTNIFLIILNTAALDSNWHLTS